ncbi:C6 transcription factor [Penicillium subrubescens]|nr:C6 transcription factor [Penicillium subrubescens]KAJ5886277.1 C6 transcription factor [Penicillium subrubescens]
MLEFLALSRQNVLQVAQIEQAQSPQVNNKVPETFDPVFTESQVRAMMLYHQECISWIHNVVHLPTFRDQCEQLFMNNTELQGGWLALYYAMLSVTLYHSDPSILRELDIESPGKLLSIRDMGMGVDSELQPAQISELCYQKSIDALQDADFMINHSLCTIQAICLLIYVGHNIGQSDRISVLLSCGIRIAQCLCLHRQGSEPTVEIKGKRDTEQAIQQRLIDREVSKRVWWFLVRQDWLQIPFNNTYTIHPTQFSTPMPMNCDEDIARMFKSNRILEYDQEHYTQGSYTTVLNHGE